MEPHGLGAVFWPPFPSGIPQIPNEFLLLRVHRNRGTMLALKAPHLVVEILQLGIAIQMLRSLIRLKIHLHAVVGGIDEARLQPGADRVPEACSSEAR